jgi:nitroreductase
MEFEKVIERRRSIRAYTKKPVPETVIRQALAHALIAPNSSNMQSWEFYWVRSAGKKQKLVEACLSQGAARTAQELIVAVATTRDWKRNAMEVAKVLRGQKADQRVFDYYEKVMPLFYGLRWLGYVKLVLFAIIGLFRPMVRKPATSRDIQEIAIKSAALACENFMLSIANQGFDTCPMEGMDEVRVQKALGLGCADRVVMVLSVGERDPEAVLLPQVRLDAKWFLHEV